jgi:B9 domain-containing protein 1
VDTGLSQTARKNTMESIDEVVWNFPIDVTFKSTNVHGWPRLAIAVYGVDYLGRDVVRGYCSCLVPLSSGSHIVDCEAYTPVASSVYNEFMSWVMGNPPEFYDSKFVCQSDGREVTRVKSTGTIRVRLNVLTKSTYTNYVVH